MAFSFKNKAGTENRPDSSHALQMSILALLAKNKRTRENGRENERENERELEMMDVKKESSD